MLGVLMRVHYVYLEKDQCIIMTKDLCLGMIINMILNVLLLIQQSHLLVKMHLMVVLV